MTGEKRRLGPAAATDGLAPGPAAASAPHNAFLHLRLEPFISSSLIELLDVLAHPVAIAASVPSTPPPRYEPPPPSYSVPAPCHALLVDTVDDRDVPTVAIIAESDSDAASVRSADSCWYGDSAMGRSPGASNSSLCTFGTGGGSWAPMLQSELALSVIVYEFLTRRPPLSRSRSPSRDSAMTTAGLP